LQSDFGDIRVKELNIGDFICGQNGNCKMKTQINIFAKVAHWNS
jgi:hypothetical protein